MTLNVFLLFCAISSFVTLLASQLKAPRLMWLFIHYHKTGHELTRKLVASFTNHCENTSWAYRPYHRAVPREDIEIFDTDISILASPELFFENWIETFSSQERKFRIAHFVRDPFDMIVSGYIYHAQDPSPLSERWERELSYHPCLFHKSGPTEGLPFLSKQFSGLNGDRDGEILGKLYGVVNLCHKLYSKYKSYPNMTFDQVLRAAKSETGDVFDGIRIEASRTILSPNGDLLRMGINALRENTSRAIARRFYTSEFPIGQLFPFTRASDRLYRFLMADHALVKQPFFKCMDSARAVLEAQKVAFVQSAPQAVFNTSLHVTAHLMPPVARDAYVQRLRDDPVLAPILDLVKQALS